MADKNLNINIIAKDKSKQALNKVQGNLDKTKSAVFNLRNALAGLGAGLVVKSFIDVGKQVESLQVRLKFLFGSVEEGARAFDAMAKFASKVPFSLGEIQQGAGVLAVVSKDADELASILELTGNVAAVTGLDFKTTSEQIQRSLSAGISSADLFREKGVKSMLGFKAGATVSIEETREALFKTFGANGQFAGATKDLANTLEGTLSMIGDKYFNFQKVVAEEFFVALKKEFGAFDVALSENEKTILQIAETVGQGLANAVTLGANAFKFLVENIELIKKAGLALVVFGMSKAFIGLSIAIGRASIAMVAFTKVSMKNLAGLLAAGAVLLADYTGFLDKLLSAFDKPKTIEEFASEVELLNLELSALENSGSEGFTKLQNEAAQLKKELNALLPSLKNDEVAFQNVKLMIDNVNKSLNDVPFREVKIGFDETTKSLNILQKSALDFGTGFGKEMKKAGDLTKQLEDAGGRAFNNFSNSIADSLLTGKFAFQDFARSVIQDISRIIAKQLVMLAIQKALGFFGVTDIFGVSVGEIFGFANGGRPPVGRTSIVGEKGPELFVPDNAGTIIPNNQLASNSGSTTVNFNITTVDAKGFNELLTNSRGTIVGMINSAVNEQGRASLV